MKRSTFIATVTHEKNANTQSSATMVNSSRIYKNVDINFSNEAVGSVVMSTNGTSTRYYYSRGI
jgi:hypothetical protein